MTKLLLLTVFIAGSLALFVLLRWHSGKVERNAQEEARRNAEEEEERKTREEAERKTREETERKTREEAEREAREKAEHKTREEAERKTREEAERKAREEAEGKTREEAERKAQEEVERKVQEEAEWKEREEAELRSSEPPEPAPTETGLTSNPPTYQPLTPPGKSQRTSGQLERTSLSTSRAETDLRLRLQLVFDRSGSVKTLALVAERREGMPENVEVTSAQGELRLTEPRDDCYEAVPLVDAGNALQRGIGWRGCGDASRWRWVLSGRELHVLASGDVSGLYPFGSSARLMLNARHVVLATVRLRAEVLAALDETGSVLPEICDDSIPGVPSGWLLFREVIHTRAVPMRDERDILNALCPVHEIEPHFVGGIRLERNSYLAGYPPRIRLTGELRSDFHVLIDDQQVHLALDGAFEAPGWDAEGNHQLWFGDRAKTYSLHKMEESWESWHAHDFVIGATICGAGIYLTDSTNWRQVRLPATNPLLIGARPGEIFCSRAHHDVRSETILALVPFSPVWALPIDPAHADKRWARLIQLDSAPPTATDEQLNTNRSTAHALRSWIDAINDAGRKQLALAVESEDSKTLWRRYRTLAKQLWRRVR